jgi:hypothetical protein
MKRLCALLFALALVSGCAVAAESSDDDAAFACDSPAAPSEVAEACTSGVDSQFTRRCISSVCKTDKRTGVRTCRCDQWAVTG